MSYEQDMPLSVIDPEADEGSLVVTFDWTPGQEPTGFSGPPENYDPGSADEFTILSARYDVAFPHVVGLADHEHEAVIEWLDENWKRPEPDYDYLNDMRRDEELLAKAEESGAFDDDRTA